MSKAVRKFWLRRADGAMIDLNGAAGIWATEPTGLGVELAPSYGNLTYGFFQVLQDQYEPQTAVGLRLVFTSQDPYKAYHDLSAWISAAGDGLLLLYQPPGGSVYYRRVRLQYLKKEELDKVGWLIVPASFLPSTPWYLPSSAPADIGADSADLMRYAWRYGSARYGTSHAAAYAATLQPMGDLPAVLRLTFTGTATTPVITLTGLATGTVYGRVVIDTTLQAGDRLEYSSAVNDSYLRVVRGGEIISLDNALDPTADPYFRMPVSEPCTLQISGQAIDGTAAVSVSYLFRTV